MVRRCGIFCPHTWLNEFHFSAAMKMIAGGRAASRRFAPKLRWCKFKFRTRICFSFFRMKFFFVLVNKFFLVCCGQKGGSVKVLLVNLQCFGEFVLWFLRYLLKILLTSAKDMKHNKKTLYLRLNLGLHYFKFKIN